MDRAIDVGCDVLDSRDSDWDWEMPMVAARNQHRMAWTVAMDRMDFDLDLGRGKHVGSRPDLPMGTAIVLGMGFAWDIQGRVRLDLDILVRIDCMDRNC